MIDGVIIDRVSATISSWAYNGSMFDVGSPCPVLNWYVRILYRVRRSLPLQSLKLVYNSLIYPNIIYCYTVWGSCNNSTRYLLFILQKRILYAIYGSRVREHSLPSFNSLKILTLCNVFRHAQPLHDLLFRHAKWSMFGPKFRLSKWTIISLKNNWCSCFW